MKRLITIFSLLAFFVIESRAQEFLAPYETFFSGQLAYVVTTEDEVIYGELRSAVTGPDRIKKLSMVDGYGKKHKFKASKIQRFAIQPSFFGKVEAVAENSSSLKELSKVNFNELVNREWLIYEQVLLPRRKKEKYALMQLLNPGFSGRIKVFHNANADETMPIRLGGIRVVGGEDRSYIVVKDNQQAIFVRKAGFVKDFGQLFGDSPDFIKKSTRRPKFKNFASHVEEYNSLSPENLN